MLLAILNLLYIEVNCQYSPMLNEGSEWHHYFWFEASCNHKLIVENDTIINGISYKKIENQGDICNYPAKIYLREDLSEKEVFYLFNDTTEIKIYDFSMQIGDTLKSLHPYFNFELVLDSISSKLPQFSPCSNYPEIFIQSPKVFYLTSLGCDNCEPVVWVESIGNIANPFVPEVPWTAGNLGDALLCHFDGTGIKDYYYVFCEEPEPCMGPILSTELEPKENNIIVFPNPSGNEIYLRVTNENVRIVKVNFYDSSGRLIGFKNQPLHTIDLSNFVAGIIFMEISTNQGQRIIKKIMKK